MTGRQFLETFQIFWNIPEESIVFADGALFVNGDNHADTWSIHGGDIRQL